MSSGKTIVGLLDVSTRGKRRKSAALVIDLLEKILAAEEAYRDRIPLNLRGGAAYAAADDSVDIVTGAIISLLSAYE